METNKADPLFRNAESLTPYASAIKTMKYCPHCAPLKRTSHFDSHFEYAIELLTMILIAPWNLLGLTQDKLDEIVGFLALFFTKLSVYVGITHAEKDFPEIKLRNRCLIFLHEAKKRCLDIRRLKIINRYTNEFVLTYNGRRYYYEEVPLLIFASEKEFDTKNKSKKFFTAHTIPIAEGSRFFQSKTAIEYGMKLGFPLVVKPNTGSLSVHATYPISSRNELVEAVRIAQQYRPDIIVERFIEGHLYRATVIGRQCIFVCRKDPAHVIGDGISTIHDLIDQKNSTRETEEQSATLHKIPPEGLLVKSDYIPKFGERVILHKKCILSLGCDIISCTDALHIDNRKLFLEIADLLKTDLIGIDFICPDISKSWHEQQAAVIEVNSLPYLDMHAFPSDGHADPVAKTVWDVTLERINNLK